MWKCVLEASREPLGIPCDVSAVALATPFCRHCHGSGAVRSWGYWRGCACVYRSVFRACLATYRHCQETMGAIGGCAFERIGHAHGIRPGCDAAARSGDQRHVLRAQGRNVSGHGLHQRGGRRLSGRHRARRDQDLQRDGFLDKPDAGSRSGILRRAGHRSGGNQDWRFLCSGCRRARAHACRPGAGHNRSQVRERNLIPRPHRLTSPTI